MRLYSLAKLRELIKMRSVCVSNKDHKDAPIRYDILIVATGVAHSYFGHDEFAKFATGFVLVGAPTGVELSAALAVLVRSTLKTELRRIDPATARIVLVDTAPRVLDTFALELFGGSQTSTGEAWGRSTARTQR
jgi:NADH dehydrogenase FAD-containing subunit